MPNDTDEFTVDTDASDFAVGAVLSQRQEGVERVIAYASRSLDRRERNYCVTRKELLAVVWFLRVFKQYLLGRRFKVRTDHAALSWLRHTPDPIGQQARWLEQLEEFDFVVEHRPGVRHGNADAMSRRMCPRRGCVCKDDGQDETVIQSVIGSPFFGGPADERVEMMFADQVDSVEIVPNEEISQREICQEARYSKNRRSNKVTPGLPPFGEPADRNRSTQYRWRSLETIDEEVVVPVEDQVVNTKMNQLLVVAEVHRSDIREPDIQSNDIDLVQTFSSVRELEIPQRDVLIKRKQKPTTSNLHVI